MPFLTIDGNPYWVLSGGATEGEGEYLGEDVRSADNTLRIGSRLHKRNFAFSLEPLSASAAATLVSLCRTTPTHTVSGDAVQNVAVLNCQIRVREVPWLMNGLSFQRGIELFIREG